MVLLSLYLDTHLNFIYYGMIFQLLVIFICFVVEYTFIYNYKLLSLTLALVLHH